MNKTKEEIWKERALKAADSGLLLDDSSPFLSKIDSITNS